MQAAQTDMDDSDDLLWLLNSLGPGGVNMPSTDSMGTTPMLEEPVDVPLPIAQPQPPAVLPAVLPPDAERCWGAEVSGTVACCVPGFKPGKAREWCAIRTCSQCLSPAACAAACCTAAHR